MQGLCGGWWEFIQIQLIKVYEGLTQQTALQQFVGNIQQVADTQLVYFLLDIVPLLSLTAPLGRACHIQHVDHVYGDIHDMNLFSSRFTPDMGNATLLMATRPHPGKPSRVEWEMGWRSCWISNRTSICPSGERRVSLKTICPI